MTNVSEAPMPPLPPDDPNRHLTVARPNQDETLPHLGLVGDTYTILVTGNDTDGKYTLIDMHVPPGEVRRLTVMTSKRCSACSRVRSKSRFAVRSLLPKLARPSTCRPTHRTLFVMPLQNLHDCCACVLLPVKKNSSPKSASPLTLELSHPHPLRPRPAMRSSPNQRN